MGFESRYTTNQREAATIARLDRGLTLQEVANLAAAGELALLDGTKLDRFELPLSTIDGWAKKAKEKRFGRVDSDLSNLPPRDAIEVLRRRLVNLTEGMLTAEENKQPKDRDPARAREIANALKATQAIPGKDEPRKPAPGQKVNGKQTEGRVRSGMAGDLLKAHRQQGRQAMTAQGNTHSNNGHTEKEGAAQHSEEAEERTGTEEDAPGSLARSAGTHLVG